jgi:hypothetical protein
MKTVLLLAFCPVCLVMASSASAIDLESICVNRSNIAESIMKLRQLGIPIEQIKKNNAALTADELLKLDADSGLIRELRDYFDALAVSAYQSPRHESGAMQQKSIDGFRDRAYQECFGLSVVR